VVALGEGSYPRNSTIGGNWLGSAPLPVEVAPVVDPHSRRRIALRKPEVPTTLSEVVRERLGWVGEILASQGFKGHEDTGKKATRLCRSIAVSAVPLAGIAPLGRLPEGAAGDRGDPFAVRRMRKVTACLIVMSRRYIASVYNVSGG
jgi:hypothetical protein